VVGVALILAALAVFVADRLHTLHIPCHSGLFVKRYCGYTVWAFMQEFLLMDFFLLRLLRMLPDSKKTAVMATACLFAVAHLPNPILAPATLLWGVAGSLLFLRYRNLYTLAMVHAIMGICIATTIPGPVNHNMRVGLGYLYYRPPVQHQRSQKDHIVSTQAWVIAEAATRRC
jgi:membrane protease YdiL (CAAX protease family)